MVEALNDSGYPFFGSFAKFYDLKEQNLRSKTLSEIETSRIEIKVVFDELKDAKVLAKEEYNELLKKNLIELENEGYYHLDAPIAQALLSHPELIPKVWEEITDSDGTTPPYIIPGNIGYYGTTFVLKDDPTGEENVLTPFFCRGRWEEAGHNTKYFNQEQLANMGDRISRTYAAVYKPDATMTI